MTTFLLILKNDWRVLRRGRALGVLTGVVLLSGLYSLFYGKTVIDRQRATLALLQQDEHARLDSLRSWVLLDTTKAANRAKWLQATDPYEVDVPEGYRYTQFTPSSVAPLALGMRDLFPYYHAVMGRAVYRQVFQQEIVNPQKLAVGHFDWAFVVIFVLPLLLIALSYNLLSGEQEGGTYALLRSQPVTLREVVGAKLTLRLLLLIGLLTGLMLLAVPILSGVDWAALGRFWVVSVAYLLLWGAFVWWVVSWQKSSAVNALTLLGFWLGLVLALPAGLQQLLTVSHPIDRTRLENTVRDEYSLVRPDSVVLKPFYARYPALYIPTDTAKRDPELRPYYARNWAIDQAVRPIVARYNKQVEARETWVDCLGWLLPAVTTQTLFNDLAGTSSAAYRDYLQQLTAFHTRWNAFFVPKVFHKQRLDASDYAHFPVWSFEPTQSRVAIGGGLIKLLLGTLLLFGLGWWRLGDKV